MKKAIIFSVGFLVLVGGLIAGINFGDKASAATYKFSVYDEVRVISSVPKLDVWSFYGVDASFNPPKVVGTEAAGNKGIIQNWPHSGKWQVKWNDGITGWSDEASLEKVPVAAPSVYKVGDWVVTNSSVNLRTSPGLAGGIYKTISSGVQCNFKQGPTQSDGLYWWGATCNLPGMTNIMIFMAEGNWIAISPPPGQNQPPVISGISGPTTLETYVGGVWNWNVTDPEGDAYSCNKTKWGDGIEDMETSHYYVQPGSYTITFSCQDAWGAVGTATTAVTVTQSANGNNPGGTPTGGKVSFTPTITGPMTLSQAQDGQWSLSVVATGISFTFAVDWGDGSKDSYTPNVSANASTKVAVHKYTTGGIYTVTFTAADNASGVKGVVTTSVGVLDPAMLTRFAVGTKLRTTDTATVMSSQGDGSISSAALGSRPKYSISKVNDEYIPNFKMPGKPVMFWGGDWWVRVAFSGWKTGWVKASQLEEMCPTLSATQLSSPARFAAGECVWVAGGLTSSLSVRGSVPVSVYPFYNDPSPIGSVKGGTQGVLISGPTAVNDFVWWQVSWENGLQGWSVGNWIVSDRSKPKSTGETFTPNATTTIYFSPQGGRVVGQAVDPNGQIVGRWRANTPGAISLPEFVGSKWWYQVVYTPPGGATLRGWSREEDLFGAGTPGNDVVVTPPSCASRFLPGGRVQVSPTTFPAMAFSQSDPPGRNLSGIQTLNGAFGTVKKGPQLQNGICWWQIGYDSSSYSALWTDARYLLGSGSTPTSTTDGQRAGLTDIVVDSPKSGETYHVGDTLTIRWGTPIGVASLHLYLWGVGSIAFSVPNSGSYDWIIPDVLNGQPLAGGNFVVQIYAADTNTPFNAKSPSFSVIAGDVVGGSGLRRGCTIRTTDNLNVRSSASVPAADPSANVLGTIPMGTQGVIGDGPVAAVGYTWWYVDFPGALDGWSVDAFFQRISCP